MRLEEAIEEFSFFYEGDYITRGMSEAKDIVLDELEKKDTEINKLKNVIDKMAEQLAGLAIWDNNKKEPLILTDVAEVKEYFMK